MKTANKYMRKKQLEKVLKRVKKKHINIMNEKIVKENHSIEKKNVNEPNK